MSNRQSRIENAAESAKQERCWLPWTRPAGAPGATKTRYPPNRLLALSLLLPDGDTRNRWAIGVEHPLNGQMLGLLARAALSPRNLSPSIPPSLCKFISNHSCPASCVHRAWGHLQPANYLCWPRPGYGGACPRRKQKPSSKGRQNQEGHLTTAPSYATPVECHDIFSALLYRQLQNYANMVGNKKLP